MYRKIVEKLIDWKKEDKKTLLISGARHVGKHT